MLRHERNNDYAITRGLKWLTNRRDVIEERGMLQLLEAATKYAVSIHDHSHFGHRITGDSHGWALVKDGKIIGLGVNEGKHGEGRATEQLKEEAARVSSKGYVGIVLASMTANRDNGRPIIFETEYEIDILNDTAEEIEYIFPKFFRRIS